MAFTRNGSMLTSLLAPIRTIRRLCSIGCATNELHAREPDPVWRLEAFFPARKDPNRLTKVLFERIH
jgi:hypothetical protein